MVLGHDTRGGKKVSNGGSRQGRAEKSNISFRNSRSLPHVNMIRQRSLGLDIIRGEGARKKR